jgi:hypothetical protein
MSIHGAHATISYGLGGIQTGVSDRREPVHGVCGKNFLFFTLRSTCLDPALPQRRRLYVAVVKRKGEIEIAGIVRTTWLCRMVCQVILVWRRCVTVSMSSLGCSLPWLGAGGDRFSMGHFRRWLHEL